MGNEPEDAEISGEDEGSTSYPPQVEVLHAALRRLVAVVKSGPA